MKTKLNLEITGAPSAWRLNSIAQSLVSSLRSAGFVTRNDAVVLSISCVNSKRMTQLNAKYRGKRKPTDVLSFEQKHEGYEPRGICFLGDLVLCREVVRKQAKEQNHGIRQELAVLIAHGLLHLLGYDHERSARDQKAMAAAEKRLLNRSGLIARQQL